MITLDVNRLKNNLTMLAIKYILLIFVLLTLAVNINAQNSKSIPYNEQSQQKFDPSDVMFVCVKIPNNLIATNDVSGDSTNTKVQEFIKSYKSLYDQLKDDFRSDKFQKIIVTRENYYLLTSEQQLKLKSFLEFRNYFFQTQLTAGLISPNHFVLNEKDFEELSIYTVNK